ncbi:MAG: periplasmic heavy metal sensor [Pseudomonadota bacterium]
MTTEGDGPNGSIEDDGATARPRAPRWMSLLLIASLGANLLVVGVLGGAALRSMAEEDDGLNRRERLVQRLLPESHYDAWKTTVHAAHDEKQAIRSEIITSHMRMVTILRTDPFEAEAMMSAFGQRMALQQKMLGLTGRQIVTMASSMTFEERKVMADRLEAFAKRRAKRHAERAAAAAER